MARDQNVRVDQVLADNDPAKTGDKMEAVIANRIQEDWVLCGAAAQESTFAPLPTVIHLVFVKPEGRRSYGQPLQVSPAGFTAKQWEAVERFANEVPDKFQMPCVFCGGGGVVNAIEGGQAPCPKCSPVGEVIERSVREAGVIVGALLDRLGTNKVILSAAQLRAAPRSSSVWFERNPDGSVIIEVKP